MKKICSKIYIVPTELSQILYESEKILSISYKDDSNTDLHDIIIENVGDYYGKSLTLRRTKISNDSTLLQYVYIMVLNV